MHDIEVLRMFLLLMLWRHINWKNLHDLDGRKTVVRKSEGD